MNKAEKYTRGVKPSSKSEYFGKSYKELQHELKGSSKAKALSKAKNKGDDWAEKHGQVKGKQLVGTITGRKFGPKSY